MTGAVVVPTQLFSPTDTHGMGRFSRHETVICAKQNDKSIHLGQCVAAGRSYSMQTKAIENLCTIKGVSFPSEEHFRQIVVTGPPGSGKTTLITQIGGWPEEGYLDLAANNWWRNRLLTFRPREVHFGLPFQGFDESHAVFDREWLEAPAKIDFDRICLPPEEKSLLGTDWRRRYVFDFQLPPVDVIYETRKDRLNKGTHPVDMELTRDIVRRQVEVYTQLAVHFHRNGLSVVVRESFQGEPRYIV